MLFFKLHTVPEELALNFLNQSAYNLHEYMTCNVTCCQVSMPLLFIAYCTFVVATVYEETFLLMRTMRCDSDANNAESRLNFFS